MGPMTLLGSRDRLVFPLDVPDLANADAWIGRFSRQGERSSIGTFKVGLELFTASGPAAVQSVERCGARCFLDLKLHDIPETMVRATRAAISLGVSYLTVHASAGPTALRRIAEASAGSPLTLLAVTALTSLGTDDLRAVGIQEPVSLWTERLADVAFNAGVRGFVCSPHECAALRARFGPDVFLVTPGIRPQGTDAHDQTRVATPGEALRAGADLLVVGRPIRDAIDPAAAARDVLDEIERVLGAS